jgi:hypothetical protein
MKLEQAIHQRWEATEALNSLLPVAGVTTGRSFDTSLPYASITRTTVRTILRTNSGDALDEVLLEIHVWHDDYDAGREIVQQVNAAMDRADFPLSDGGQVLQMRRAGQSDSEHDDGVWRFTLRFLVQVYLPFGV